MLMFVGRLQFDSLLVDELLLEQGPLNRLWIAYTLYFNIFSKIKFSHKIINIGVDGGLLVCTQHINFLRNREKNFGSNIFAGNKISYY